jgi:TetR/AcrR family transcriptional regulator
MIKTKFKNSSNKSTNGMLVGKSNPSKQRNSRQKILDASLKEFAAYGFDGARVDRIAKKAGINKAMIFYYFSSKQNLYHTVIKEALLDFIPKVQKVIREALNPESFFEALPRLYIRYFSQRKEILQIIARNLIHSPKTIGPLISEIFSQVPDAPSKTLPDVIQRWHRLGMISESDPIQFIFNIVALCFFPIIAQPMVEAILDARITDDPAFLEKRIRSIAHLLKRGMLK